MPSGRALDIGQQSGTYPQDMNTPLYQNHGFWDITAKINSDNQKTVCGGGGRGEGILG